MIEKRFHRRRTGLIALGVGILALTTVGLAPAQHHEKGAHHGDSKGSAAVKPQTTCPVMGGKVDKNLYVEKDGKRIYLCCTGCIEPVNADFDKYVKKIEAKGETVAHEQTICPIMGGKVNKDLYVNQGGKRIYICCRGCVKPVQENFDKNVEKIEASGQYVADTPMKAK